jgi:hypothetical protein
LLFSLQKTVSGELLIDSTSIARGFTFFALEEAPWVTWKKCEAVFALEKYKALFGEKFRRVQVIQPAFLLLVGDHLRPDGFWIANPSALFPFPYSVPSHLTLTPSRNLNVTLILPPKSANLCLAKISRFLPYSFVKAPL